MTKVIWKTARFNGTLKSQNKSIKVQFKVHCDITGRLFFAFSRIPLNKSFWLLHHLKAGGRYIDFLTLDGVDSSGQSIHTDYFILTGYSPTSNKRSSFITPEGTTEWLEVAQKSARHSSTSVIVRYRIVGIQGYGVQRAVSELGRIQLGAKSEIENYDELTGRLDIETTSQAGASSELLERCDRQADMILEVLSIAQDRRLDWSIRKVYEGGNLSSILFVGPKSGTPPQHPIFSHLHLQPALDLAVHAYTDRLRDVMGMGFAIEYFLMRPPFGELKFIATMTGLEHMIQRFSSHGNRGVIVPKSTFKKCLLTTMRCALFAEIDRLNTENLEKLLISAEASKLLDKRLSEINGLSLRNKIFQFLRSCKIPLHGISEEKIANLALTRNDLAHARKHRRTPHAERLDDDLAVLHELMRRIFLTLLGYRGQRYTFLNGQEWVDFPPIGGKS